jgi:preprotein translocase subunit SecD
VLVVAALGAGLAACGDSNDEPAREDCGAGAACATLLPTSTVPLAPVDLQLRPVLSADPASIEDNPCPTDLPVPVPTEIIVAPGCSDGVIDVLYGLGPSALDGSAFESARAVDSQGGWVVNPVLKQGAAGLDLFNAAAAHCYAKDETCPTGQLAIVIDGVVISAPTIQEPSFQADQIQIAGGPFTEAQATALAGGIDAAG